MIFHRKLQSVRQEVCQDSEKPKTVQAGAFNPWWQHVRDLPLHQEQFGGQPCQDPDSGRLPGDFADILPQD